MPRFSSDPRRAIVIAVLGIVACWVLATPRNAGPDEPSHLVASAALVRGDTDGVDIGVEYWAEQYRVPAMVGEPNPGCFALDPGMPAGCEGVPADDTDLVGRESTSAGYPIWGHVLPGLASFVPDAGSFAYVARALNAMIPVALLVAALLRLRRRASQWLLTGLFVGLTPIAWFTMSVVNPSAIAIAGGGALWAATLSRPPDRGDALLAASWMAVLLPRRDGPVWATLIIAFACLATSRLPSDMWRRLDTGGRAAVAVSLPLTMLPTLMNGYDRLNTLLPFVLLALPVGELAVRWWRSAQRPTIRPGFVALGALTTAAAAVVAANVLRPGGPDTEVTWRIVGNTGRHLRQIVGLLGWLDTPPPEFALLLWWVTLGAVAMLALLAAPRLLAVAAGVFGTAIVMSWVLELGTGDGSGTYWQGRYSLPLLIGVPMVLALGADPGLASARRVTLCLRGAVWTVWNAAFYSAMRRWGVGVNGTVYPWRWNTWDVPAHPALFLLVHGAATAWLLGRGTAVAGPALSQPAHDSSVTTTQ